MTATSSIVGSWFPSGYYGHFRSKARNDFMCEYRMLARPQPPEKFFYRAMQPIDNHAFSKHDNRDALMSDAQYFSQGTGRKRNSDAKYDFNPDFYTWMPEREVIERSRPLVSTYRLDFNVPPGKNPKQLLTQRPKTSFDNGRHMTTYMYAHGNVAPNLQEIKTLNDRALGLTTYSRQQRAATARPLRTRCNETVASCLNWYVPKPPSEPKQGVSVQTEAQPQPKPPCVTECSVPTCPGPECPGPPCQRKAAPVAE